LSDLLPKEVLLIFPESAFGCCGDCAFTIPIF
ncbi:hypothetical protein T08_5047, partial [Trichinella sp. T8]